MAGARALQELTNRAGGLFVWATTALDFVKKGIPEKRLRSILTVIGAAKERLILFTSRSLRSHSKASMPTSLILSRRSLVPLSLPRLLCVKAISNGSSATRCHRSPSSILSITWRPLFGRAAHAHLFGFATNHSLTSCLILSDPDPSLSTELGRLRSLLWGVCD